MLDYPQAQTVRLFFVDNPHYQEEVSGKGLCDQLKASGRNVVDVEFDVSGNSRRGVHYYMESKIDGKKIVDIGGWGSSGSHSNGTQDPIGKFPLASVFEK